ncbi:MAG TPA: hypothetical protein VF746_13380 [Longimicrobium sp.]|jgi:hypothetical protein
MLIELLSEVMNRFGRFPVTNPPTRVDWPADVAQPLLDVKAARPVEPPRRRAKGAQP